MTHLPGEVDIKHSREGQRLDGSTFPNFLGKKAPQPDERNCPGVRRPWKPPASEECLWDPCTA